MEQFVGEYEYTLDEKNRLSIPAKLRKVISQNGGPALVISREQKYYLKIYPYTIWKERVANKVMNLPHSSAEANRLRRAIGRHTVDASLDNQGRIVIPPECCAHVGIDKKIRIIGAMDTLQLWDPETHDRIPPEEQDELAVEEFAKFGF